MNIENRYHASRKLSTERVDQIYHPRITQVVPEVVVELKQRTLIL